MSRRASEQATAARRQIRRAEQFNGLKALAAVLCEPTRLRIVEALMTSEFSVSELAATINKAVTATSQHLRMLRELGLIEGDRRGKAVVYRLRDTTSTENVQAVLAMLADPAREEGSRHGGTAHRPGRRRRADATGHPR